jgi:hypothetical protein
VHARSPPARPQAGCRALPASDRHEVQTDEIGATFLERREVLLIAPADCEARPAPAGRGMADHLVHVGEQLAGSDPYCFPRSASSGVHENSPRIEPGMALSDASRTLVSETDLLPCSRGCADRSAD